MPDHTFLDMRPIPSTGLDQTELTVAYETDRLGFLRRCVDEYGTIVRIGPATYVVADAAFAMTVMRKSNDLFETTRMLGREPSLGSQDPGHPAWQEWRQVVLAGQKDDAALAAHAAWVVDHTEGFCDRWLASGRIGDLRAELEVLSAASFARYAYGDAPYQDVVDRTREFLKALLVIVGSPIEIPRSLRFLPRKRRFDKTKAALEDSIGRVIPRAADDSLVGRIRDSGYEAESLQWYMVTMHAAGTVPTAALMWALVELARHPELADEVAETGDGEAFVKEVLRLWPATWVMMRETLADVSADGMTFPSGSVLLVSPFLIHRYAECFRDDPDTFRPQRWAGLRPSPGSYLPFGAGPHWCLGGRLAEVELNAIVPVLARRLRVHLDRESVGLDSRRSLQPDLNSLRVSAR
jgi:cytochrome P450